MKKAGLIKHLKENTRVLTSERVEAALRSVDRKQFVPKELQGEAYEDYPLPIGHGATISQPTTVAFMLEQLDVEPGQKVLDIGSGSGWTTALLAHLVGAKGKVIGLEIIPELVALGRENLSRFYSYIPTNVGISEKESVILSHQGKWTGIRQAEKGIVGVASEAPFDRILVSAATEKIPQALVDQLNPGGKMILPIGATDVGHTQSVTLVEKQKDGTIKTTAFPGFAFVPLKP